MNKENFELFSKAYRLALVISVDAFPEKYVLPNEPSEMAVLKHAERILNEIARNPKGVNYNGDAFKLVCKTLAIKNTRKAIFEYLEIH
jgi:hypothetical protein